MTNVSAKPLNTNEPESLGERLRFSRDLAKLSRRELAETTGMSARTIEHYENGTTDATYQKLCQLSDALGVEITWLVSGGETNETEFGDTSDDGALEDNAPPPETTPGTAQLMTFLETLVNLREAGFEKRQRKATAIMQDIHSAAKYIEPAELAWLASQREVFIVKDYSPEVFSDLIHSTTNRHDVETLCIEIADRLIDHALLGVDLFKVKLKDLAALAENWEIEPNRILAFSWRGYEEIVPALRSKLRKQALSGRPIARH